MTRRTLILNNMAFTLVEVMVAVFILTIGLLGMLQVINLAISTNLQNDMRNQGVLVAEQQLAQVKARPFDDLSVATERSVKVSVPMRSTLANYSVTMGVTDVGNGKKIDVGVRWRLKANRYEHVVSTIVTKNQQ